MYHIHAYSGSQRRAAVCTPGHPDFAEQREAHEIVPTKTGIHATKWPPSAQEARPAGQIL